MLTFKYNVLFSILCRKDDCVGDSIRSCLEQEQINPFIVVTTRNCDNSFYRAKTFCKNPSVYEPDLISDYQMMVCRSLGQEHMDIFRVIDFGIRNNCKYYCFMHCPTIMNKDFCKKAITKIKDDIIAAYSNVMDSGIKIYTSAEYEINTGPLVVTSEKYARAFNHGNMQEYLNSLGQMGCFYQLDGFPLKNNWINTLC